MFETVQMRRVDFLNGVLQRLQDEVGTIFSFIERHNIQSILQKGRTIGFWAGIRMLMPIIEAASGSMGIKPQELIGKHLNISTPYLAWDLFRHSLIHGDTPYQGKYQGKTVYWAIGSNSGKHIIGQEYIHIDLRTLYDDLVIYLQTEIANNDQTLINIKNGVNYQNPKQEIIDDFTRL
jgi:hypothetical protein